MTSHWRRLAALWDDTKSCGLSVVQLGEKCSATMWTLVALTALLKGLILRQEVEDRDEKEDSLDCSTMNKEHSGDIPSEKWVLISYWVEPRRHRMVVKS